MYITELNLAVSAPNQSLDQVLVGHKDDDQKRSYTKHVHVWKNNHRDASQLVLNECYRNEIGMIRNRKKSIGMV